MKQVMHSTGLSTITSKSEVESYLESLKTKSNPNQNIYVMPSEFDKEDLRLFKALNEQPAWTKQEENNSEGTQFFGNNGWHRILAKNVENGNLINYFQGSNKFGGANAFDYKKLRPNYDIYFTLNTFNQQSGLACNIDKLNGLYVDIDFSKYGFTWDQAYSRVCDIIEDKMLYKPNYIINSGNGMWLLWLFEESVGAGTEKIVNLYRVMLQKLANIFAKVGGDFAAATPERLIRYPQTFNHKNQERKATKLISVGDMEDYLFLTDDTLWSFDDFKENILDYDEYKAKLELSKKIRESKRKSFEVRKKEWETKNPGKTYSQNFHWRGDDITLGLRRAEDIERLVWLRSGEMTGVRALTGYYYKNSLVLAGFSEGEIEARWEVLASQFSQPLEKADYKGVLKAPINYIPRNDTIINALLMGPEEISEMKTIIDRKEKNKRKAARSKRQYKSIKNQNGYSLLNKRYIAFRLKEQGFSATEISNILNVSNRTARNYAATFQAIITAVDNGGDTIFCNFDLMKIVGMVSKWDTIRFKTSGNKEEMANISLDFTVPRNLTDTEDAVMSTILKFTGDGESTTKLIKKLATVKKEKEKRAIEFDKFVTKIEKEGKTLAEVRTQIVLEQFLEDAKEQKEMLKQKVAKRDQISIFKQKMRKEARKAYKSLLDIIQKTDDKKVSNPI